MRILCDDPFILIREMAFIFPISSRLQSGFRHHTIVCLTLRHESCLQFLFLFQKLLLQFPCFLFQESLLRLDQFLSGRIAHDDELAILALDQNGITDIDVAIVPLASIRASVKEGPLTAADAFSICYAAEEGPYAEGAPLVCAYLSGKDLKLLTEIDASLGPAQSGVKLSYAGLNYRFNTKRILMDRVTSVGLARSGGMLELNYGSDGYDLAFRRIAEQEAEQQKS